MLKLTVCKGKYQRLNPFLYQNVGILVSVAHSSKKYYIALAGYLQKLDIFQKNPEDNSQSSLRLWFDEHRVFRLRRTTPNTKRSIGSVYELSTPGNVFEIPFRRFISVCELDGGLGAYKRNVAFRVRDVRRHYKRKQQYFKDRTASKPGVGFNAMIDSLDNTLVNLAIGKRVFFRFLEELV